MLDVPAQKQGPKHAALKPLPRFLRFTGIHPDPIVTNMQASYRAAVEGWIWNVRDISGGELRTRH